MRRFDLVTGTAYGLLRTLLRPCSLRSARPLQGPAVGCACKYIIYILKTGARACAIDLFTSRVKWCYRLPPSCNAFSGFSLLEDLYRFSGINNPQPLKGYQMKSMGEPLKKAMSTMFAQVDNVKYDLATVQTGIVTDGRPYNTQGK